jgi:putative membrane protein
MMGYGGFGAGAMGFGAVWMIVFWVLVIAGVGLLLRQLLSSPAERGIEGRPAAPLDVLGGRYASGEIGKEEFEQKKQDLSK